MQQWLVLYMDIPLMNGIGTCSHARPYTELGYFTLGAFIMGMLTTCLYSVLQYCIRQLLVNVADMKQVTRALLRQ